MPPPEGWPWLLGGVSGRMGKKAVAWQTYDFSIGALDASVWAGETDGMVGFHLRALPPGKPKAKRMMLVVIADIGKELRVGPAAGAIKVDILRYDKREGARMSSEGQSASLVIDRLARDADSNTYGKVSGKVTARLCPIKWAGKACQDFSATFVTGMQFDGTFEIVEGGQ